MISLVFVCVFSRFFRQPFPALPVAQKRKVVMSSYTQFLRPEDISAMAANMNHQESVPSDSEGSGNTRHSNENSKDRGPDSDDDTIEGISHEASSPIVNLGFHSDDEEDPLVETAIQVEAALEGEVIEGSATPPPVPPPNLAVAEVQVGVDDNDANALSTLNGPSSWTPPTDDADKGSLQRFMEELHNTIEANEALSKTSSEIEAYIFMLCKAEFADWDVANKEPYKTIESKEMKAQKPSG